MRGNHRAIIEMEDGYRHVLDIAEIISHPDAPVEIRGYVFPVFETSNRLRKSQNSIIKDVIFNDPATIVIWSDGSKTVVKCQPGDTYSKETGLALCIAKKYLGNKGNFNEVFKKYITED